MLRGTAQQARSRPLVPEPWDGGRNPNWRRFEAMGETYMFVGIYRGIDSETRVPERWWFRNHPQHQS